jgi:hypothetical protein
MKTCPACKQTYTDNELYFCLNDGEMLVAKTADTQPTIFMDAPRTTNQNWQGTPQNTNFQNRQVTPNQQFNSPVQIIGQNQTLPTISLILGIIGLLSSCCWGGFPLGLIAVILGYLGIRNVNSNPQQYGGNNLAIGGIICGIVGFLISFGMLILIIISPSK